MQVSLNVIYGGDRSQSKIENVPSTCDIQSVKEMIKKINQMSSIETIKIIQNGKILNNAQTLNGLVSDGNNQITIYATGIPNKIRKGINKSQNLRKENLYGQIKDRFNAKDTLKVVGMCVGIICLTIYFAVMSTKPDNVIPFAKIPVRSFLMFLGSLFIIGAFISYKALKNGNLSLLKKCAIQFFKVLLPNFNMNEFKEENFQHQ